MRVTLRSYGTSELHHVFTLKVCVLGKLHHVSALEVLSGGYLECHNPPPPHGGPYWLRVELTILESDCPSVVSWDLSCYLSVVSPYLLCVIVHC